MRMPITLAPDLDEEPDDGLLFVSDDRLRYFAPQRAGEYEANYRSKRRAVSRRRRS